MRGCVCVCAVCVAPLCCFFVLSKPTGYTYHFRSWLNFSSSSSFSFFCSEAIHKNAIKIPSKNNHDDLIYTKTSARCMPSKRSFSICIFPLHSFGCSWNNCVYYTHILLSNHASIRKLNTLLCTMGRTFLFYIMLLVFAIVVVGIQCRIFPRPPIQSQLSQSRYCIPFPLFVCVSVCERMNWKSQLPFKLHFLWEINRQKNCNAFLIVALNSVFFYSLSTFQAKSIFLQFKIRLSISIFRSSIDFILLCRFLDREREKEIYRYWVILLWNSRNEKRFYFVCLHLMPSRNLHSLCNVLVWSAK